MSIHIIGAVAENRVIGHLGELPWLIPADLQHFRDTTIGHNIIMGRKTFESLKNTPLPERHNIVLTGDPSLLKSQSPKGYKNLELTSDFLTLLEKAKSSDEEYWVIGGAEVYAMFLPFVDSMSITILNYSPKGDTLFPEVQDDQWDIDVIEEFVTDDRIYVEFTEWSRKRKRS